MKNRPIIVISLLLILIAFFTDTFAQTKNNNKYFRIQSGYIFNTALEFKDFNHAIYLAPSFLIKRHEFTFGVLMTKERSYQTPFWGYLFGYNFYILKTLRRVNPFINYTVQFYKYNAHESDHPGFVTIDHFGNTIGTGVNIFIDNKKIINVYGLAGFTFYFYRDKWYDDSKIGYYWKQASVSVGLNIKICSLNNK